jgi:hypothetical protein
MYIKIRIKGGISQYKQGKRKTVGKTLEKGRKRKDKWNIKVLKVKYIKKKAKSP